MLKKSQCTNSDVELYLLNYRNSPITGIGYSPAELLQSRELRIRLEWVQEDTLKPKIVTVE